MEEIMEGALIPFEWLLQNHFALAWISLFMVLATISDVRTLKIPNKLNAIFAIGNIVIFVFYPLIDGSYQDGIQSMLSALVGFVLLLIPAVITEFKMAGDIKFIGAFGFALSIPSIIVYLIVSVILNVGTNLTLVALKKKEMNEAIPFAPFFAASFIMMTVAAYIL